MERRVRERSTSRRRPASNALPGALKKKKKKDKTGVDKVASMLNKLAAAFDRFVDSDHLPSLSKKLTAALEALPGLDVRQRMAAKRFLINNVDEAQLFFDYTDEEKKIMLDDNVLVGEGSTLPRNLNIGELRKH